MPRLMTKKQVDRWAKSRARGPWAYILINGVLGSGVPAGILFATWMSFSQDQFFLDALKFSLPMLTVGGVFSGTFMWALTESDYRIYQFNQDKTS